MNKSQTRSAPAAQSLEGAETHRACLFAALAKLQEGALTKEEALQGLQHLALALLEHWRIDGFRHHMAKGLLKVALGKPVYAYTANTTIPVTEGEPAHEATTLRGVGLHVDHEGRLVRITINPRRVREYGDLMGIAGKYRSSPMDPVNEASFETWGPWGDPHGRDKRYFP